MDLKINVKSSAKINAAQIRAQKSQSSVPVRTGILEPTPYKCHINVKRNAEINMAPIRAQKIQNL